ncbi:hypothetical protein F6V30_10675 [Oryzomonas sagensis]|uniref:Uncharacterized protein n=1 Tax=Oryzomonas sagensis TaxID=2603857 RepID=A0ABQ6TPN3_9BACT|nr:hypothetical protein F6V30_10675 [Oryzomonas sagensis]
MDQGPDFRARLVENRNYLLTEKGEQLPGGMKHLKEYYLTTDSAKHIAKMSRPDKGFEVRDYFIECERRAVPVMAAGTASGASSGPRRLGGFRHRERESIHYTGWDPLP